MNENRELYRDILIQGKLGLLHRLMNFKSAAVYGKKYDFHFPSQKKPVYISY